MKYRIKLADGTELKNLALNGNNYISTEKGIESALTPVNLTNVTISDGTAEECFENMVQERSMSDEQIAALSAPELIQLMIRLVEELELRLMENAE